MDLREALTFAKEQFAYWGLDKHGWTFKFSKRMSRTLGMCVGGNVKEIRLNFDYARLNDESLVKDTILHEIAHAIVGPEQGHNEKWKKWCLIVGAKPNRCKKASQLVLPKKKYMLCFLKDCGTIEKLEVTTNRKTSLINRWVRGRPETYNRLVWLTNKE